jgi:hypothetical protein
MYTFGVNLGFLPWWIFLLWWIVNRSNVAISFDLAHGSQWGLGKWGDRKA